MIRKLTTLLLTLVASCALYAQSTPTATYTIKGVLLDSLTQETEPYATIRIVKKESPDKVVKMAVTDNKGRFQEKIADSGQYVITITSIGKATVYREFILKPEEKTFDFGTLYTSDATNELKGIEVVAQKPLVKVDIDKIEYNVADDPDSKTNSILEMLRKVPLVTVDGEDKIQVNGSSSFKVHVNGKPNNMMSDNPTEVLKSMPANTIRYIEVITNPGAKYDAEGIGGILNIVTTVDSGIEGYTATFSGNASNMGAGGSVYATVKKEKLTVSGRYAYNYNDRPASYSNMERNDAESKTKEGEVIPATKLINSSKYKGTGSFQHGSLEASYEIDTLRLITMAFGLYGGGNDGNGNGTTTQTDATNATLYSYKTLNQNDNSWYSIRGNIDYQRSFSKKGRLLTFSYNINTRPQTSDGVNEYNDRTGSYPFWLQNQRSEGEQNTTEHTFQTDYTTPIGKIHTVEAGAKYIIRNNISDNDYYGEDATTGNYVLDNKRSSHYKHLNNILAGYASYSIRVKNFSGRTGLRFERTMQDVKYKDKPEQPDFSKEYNDLVPSASIGYKLGQTQNIRLGYDMRIWRPYIFFLNPYLDDSNPTSIRQGNPNLDTEKSHQFNLSYSSFTAKFNVNVSLNHSFNNNQIESVSRLLNPSDIPGLDITSNDRVLYTTYENMGRSSNSGMSGYFNWNASPKTRVYANLSASYSVMEGEYMGEKLKNNGWQGYGYGGIQHTFPLKIRVSMNLYGSTPYIQLQGKGSSYFDYSMSVNRSFLKEDRLTLSAFASNMFKKYMTYSSETMGEGFSQTSNNKYVSQRFGMSVSYRIGQLKATVKKAARTINNDDVKGGGEGGGQATPN